MTDHGPVLALGRGDQTLHEKKLGKLIGTHRPAQKDESRAALACLRASIGHGPQNQEDRRPRYFKQGAYIGRATKERIHVKGSHCGQHLGDVEFADIHTAAAGRTPAPQCGSRSASSGSIEIGNIFQLGRITQRRSRRNYLDEQGNEIAHHHGELRHRSCAHRRRAVEQGNDENGIIWPPAIAPYQLLIVPVNMKDASSVDVAEEMYRSWRRRHRSADGRSRRAGRGQVQGR